MAIDKSGKWWVGTRPADIQEYLQAYAQDEHQVREYRSAVCTCGSDSFYLHGDPLEGAAKRVCSICSLEHFICDSMEFWEEDHVEQFRCIECTAETVNIGAGFSLEGTPEEIRWIYVGQRCTRCGVLGCFTEWKITYSPTLHLLKEI